jgi:hypothetical protein
MKPPTAVDVALFFQHNYDPAKAHEYYMRTRKLKGRQPGGADAVSDNTTTGKDPRIGKTMNEIHKDARAKQRAELSQQIKLLETKLVKLKQRLVQKSIEQDAAERKSLGKKERAAKESAKPKTAAEKAEISRESKKYRDKNQQKLSTQAESRSSNSNSGGSSTKSSSGSKSLETEISDLAALVTKVSGKIAVAKTKLAAL